MPRAAGLDAVLREVIEKKPGARSTVRLNELFDRLVTYRNMELGHGASGLRLSAFYGRMERALLGGIPEILDRLNVLAGRRLVYIADISRRSSGNWVVERFELIGEVPRRLEPLELLPAAESAAFVPDRVYLEAPGPTTATGDSRLLAASTVPGEALAAQNRFPLASVPYTPLYPLAIFDHAANELLFFNTLRSRQRCDYLCYSSGEVQQKEQSGSQRPGCLAGCLANPAKFRRAKRPPSLLQPRSPTLTPRSKPSANSSC